MFATLDPNFSVLALLDLIQAVIEGSRDVVYLLGYKPMNIDRRRQLRDLALDIFQQRLQLVTAFRQLRPAFQRDEFVAIRAVDNFFVT